jgi:hypothetical protein
MGSLGIDVDNLRESAFVRQNNPNLDFHFYMQWDASPDACSMAVNHDRLTVTFQWFTDALSRNNNLQGNPNASAPFMQGPFVVCFIQDGARSNPKD